MSKFPIRIYAAPEGEFGQGFETVKLSVWNERSTYRDEQQYVRADVADDMLEALRDVATFARVFRGRMENVPGDEALDALGETVTAAIDKAEGRS